MKRITKGLISAMVGAIGLAGYAMLKPAQIPETSVEKEVSVAQTSTDASTTETTSTSDVIEGTYPIIGTHGMIESMSSAEEIFKYAEIIAEVKVLDQETIPVAIGEVSTRSSVNVIKTLKGDAAITSMQITEFGGLLDLSTIPNMDKPGDGKQHQPNTGIVESAFEGSPVMKKNQLYLVFLRKNPNPKWGYNIIGAVQGKLKIDGQTKKIINTVDSKYADEEIFFMQRQFAGKDKDEMEATVKSKL
ncbi:hypothetical protein [Tumebacillus permanentifrigoris]|uniref:Uncharacterized protein n=1 Tax=Tumebacillus permanentifrigoris TaxID=378543 RepID=A0A316D3K6_9BACL|nr:hypothetical protein [Tumebacillus permanentifrigoris]PWK06244.1 hypothetical protein C7459_1206 [Tumebacillus permanentifrigoris]